MYQLTNGGGVIRLADNACIPMDPANRDCADYLAWIDEGNEPLPAPVEPWADRLVEEFKTEREFLLNRIGTYAAAMVFEGETEFAAALYWLRKQIIPLDEHPYVVSESAKSYEDGRAAYKAAYADLTLQALAMAPGMPGDTTVAMQWKTELDKVFK